MNQPSRHPYGKQELSRLINPSVVAVVGASPTAGSFGKRTLENIDVGYAGEVYAINPRYERIDKFACYPSIRETPKVPDCVVLAVARDHVEPVLEDCARLGVGGAVVYTSGFSELGTEEGLRAQRRFAEISRETGLRICGPNCVGIINLVDRVGLSFMPNFCTMPMVRGALGLVSQSGALGYVVLQAMERGVGFSYYLSPGNSSDVDVSDLINFLVEDRNTKAIACTFEGVSDGARLRAACRNALEAGKPLAVYKLGNNELSRTTAMSHTGTMVGQAAAYQAVFEETGAIVLNDFEHMLEAVSFFSKAGLPKARGVGVMASSGGAAVMAADKAYEHGVVLPPPAERTAARMKEVVPSFGSSGNPSDITAESLRNMEMYGHCIQAFADDPQYGVVVVPMMSAHNPTTVERAKYICDFSASVGRPVCIVWLNEWYEGPGSETYDASECVSVFRSMGRCFSTLRHWFDYHEGRERRLQKREARLTSLASVGTARDLLGGADALSALTERQSKLLLSAYGVKVNPGILVSSQEEAARAASSLGFPVVLKVESGAIAHKTEVGGVRLNLRNKQEVRSAYRAIMTALDRLPERPAIDGIVVQEMVPPGMELLIGAQQDPQFGPLIACGFGGTLVELLKDVSIAIAPVGLAQATRMIEALKGFRLLKGYRGSSKLDVDAFADMVVRVSELAADFAGEIAEIDVNPVILGVRGATAVDALVIRAARK